MRIATGNKRRRNRFGRPRPFAKRAQRIAREFGEWEARDLLRLLTMLYGEAHG